MNLYNIKHPEEQVNFAQAVRQGLGKDQGLFFPENIPHLSNIDELLALPLVERSQKILGALIGEEIPQAQLEQMVRNALPSLCRLYGLKTIFMHWNCSMAQHSPLKTSADASWPKP